MNPSIARELEAMEAFALAYTGPSDGPMIQPIDVLALEVSVKPETRAVLADMADALRVLLPEVRR